MQAIRTKIVDHFLQGYEEFPAEIVKKMRYLTFLDATGIIMYFCLFIWRFIIHAELNYFIGDLVALASLVCSLAIIRKKRPHLAGNFALCCLLAIFLHYVIGDYTVPLGKDMSRLYEALLLIFAGFYCASLFAVRARQLYALTFCSLGVNLSHFTLLFVLSYGAHVSSTITYALVFSVGLILGFGYISVNVLRLTSQKRGDIFSNIVFYKLASQGYVCFFAEHALDRDLEVSMGGYLFSAIGQGQQYHLGIFGPIPWGPKDLKQVAYVYSSMLTDSGVPDNRLKDTNYTLICLILRHDIANLVERSSLKRTLDSKVKKISDLASLTEDQIQNMVRDIHNQ